MRKRSKALLTLSALSFLVGVSWLISGPVARSKTPFTPGSLEEKARRAKGGDEDAIRDLTEEVFYQYGQMLPAEVTDGVKERVVRAEVEFRRNGKGGVRETHVVLAVNHLAEKFEAPDFAKTDHRQVKMLRARLKSQAPSFFAPDPDDKKGLKKKLGEPMNREVSPVEATCLMLVMLNQKALNDEFQHPLHEFALRARRKQSWLEADRGDSTIGVKHPRNAEKSRAVIRAATEGVSRMSTADAINLAADTLDKLGLKK